LRLPREINLADGMAEYFGHSCPKCQQIPCDCGYVIINKPICLKRRGN